MEIHIDSKLDATEGIVIPVDGKDVIFYKGDNVKISHEGAIVIEYEIKEFSNSMLTMQLKILMGNLVSPETGLITIKGVENNVTG